MTQQKIERLQFDSVIARPRNGLTKFKDSFPVLTNRGLHIGPKISLVCVVLCCGGISWLVKEGDVISLEKNDVMMVWWMCNARPRLLQREYKFLILIELWNSQTLPSWTFSVASHNLKPTKGSLRNFALNIKQID